MSLEKLHLFNFRNFQEETVYFPSNNIVKIYGSNGSGKTNLLEAIFILFTTRSFRNKKSLKECVRIGNERYFSLAAEIHGISHGITFSSETVEKNFLISKAKVQSVEFIKNKNILHFSPEDSHLFFQSLEMRRSIVDRYISAIDDQYLSQLIQFNRLRDRKVSILFSNTSKKKSLLTLDSPQFTNLSSVISERRFLFFQQINPIFQRILSIFNRKLGNSLIVYKKRPFPEDYIEKELAAERILYGCQRDPLEIMDNGKDIRQFFSNGEKKAINLAFHFSFMELLKDQKQMSCLVCLDDIESELDRRTLDNIYEIINNSTSQFLITSKLTERFENSDILLQEGKIIQL